MLSIHWAKIEFYSILQTFKIFSFEKNNLLVFLIALVFSAACNKEKVEDMKSETVNDFWRYELKKNVLVSNEEDAEDEAINWKLIQIAETLKPAVSDLSLRQAMLSAALEDEEGYVSIREVLEIVPETALEPSLYTFSHAGTAYEAVINIPNLSEADFNESPLLSPGIEVEDDDERGIRDNIFAWLLHNGETFEEVVVGEERALSMKNPLFVVTPHPIETTTPSASPYRPRPSETEAATGSPRSRTEYHSNEFKLNRRFETSGRTEFCVVAARIDDDGAVTGLPLRRDNGYYNNWKKIAEVKASDIGKDLSHWEQISDDYTPRAGYRIYFNTFERDWYSSPKMLGEGTAYGTTVILDERTKYQNEWYSFDPNLPIPDMDINFIYNTWLRTFSNSRGYLKVWRVQI